jgi:two-component system, cell cycle response regulator
MIIYWILHWTDVEQLTNSMNMSGPTLYRKLKDISTMTPNELINIARLDKAANLLKDGTYRVNEIAETVGYASTLHFPEIFKNSLGLPPSGYIKKHR